MLCVAPNNPERSPPTYRSPYYNPLYLPSMSFSFLYASITVDRRKQKIPFDSVTFIPFFREKRKKERKFTSSGPNVARSTRRDNAQSSIDCVVDHDSNELVDALSCRRRDASMFRRQVLGRSGLAITVSFLSNLLFSYYLHIYIYIYII